MLLVAPNQLLLLVTLGGPIGPVGPIEAVESNGNSTELYGRIYSNATGLEESICLLNRCCYGHQIPMYLEGNSSGPLQSIGRAVGLGRSIWMDLLYRCPLK